MSEDKCQHELFYNSKKIRFGRPCGCNYASQKPNWPAVIEYQSLAAVKHPTEKQLPILKEEIVIEKQKVILPPLPPSVKQKVILPSPPSVKQKVTLPPPPPVVKEKVTPPPPLHKPVLSPAEEKIQERFNEQFTDLKDPAADDISFIPVNIPFESGPTHCEDTSSWFWTAAAVVVIGFSVYLLHQNQMRKEPRLEWKEVKEYHHVKRQRSKKRKSKLLIETQRPYSSD